MDHTSLPHRSLLLLILTLLLAPHGVGPAVVQAADTLTQPPRNPQGIQGMWVWREQWVRDADERARLVAFCERYGFNLLMVQIHLARDDDGTPQLRFPDELADLIAQAAERGIVVEALDGAAGMALADEQPRTLAILDAILEFQASLPEDARLAGMHYDIEPYLLDEWRDPEQRPTIMHDLLVFFHKARERLNAEAPEMVLAADIPFWYSSKTEPGDSCILEFNGETKNLHKHIQDVCDYIGIMSYRIHATGSNSVVQLVQPELEYAEQIGKQVVPALETIELTDTPQITFYGRSADEFWTTHNTVRETLNDRPGFGGMLTHSYRGLRDLLEPERE